MPKPRKTICHGRTPFERCEGCAGRLVRFCLRRPPVKRILFHIRRRMASVSASLQRAKTRGAPGRLPRRSAGFGCNCMFIGSLPPGGEWECQTAGELSQKESGSRSHRDPHWPRGRTLADGDSDRSAARLEATVTGATSPRWPQGKWLPPKADALPRGNLNVPVAMSPAKKAFSHRPGSR